MRSGVNELPSVALTSKFLALCKSNHLGFAHDAAATVELAEGLLTRPRVPAL